MNSSFLQFKDFCVVDFPLEKAVEVIPSRWLISEVECKWPKTTNIQLFKLLKNSKTTPGSDWETVPCRRLAFYDTYQAAAEGRNKAEETSNLESDSSSIPSRPRRRTKKNRQRKSSSSSSSVTSVGAVAANNSGAYESFPTPSSNILINQTTVNQAETSVTDEVQGLFPAYPIIEGEYTVDVNCSALPTTSNLKSPGSLIVLNADTQKSCVVNSSVLPVPTQSGASKDYSRSESVVLRRLARIKLNQQEILNRFETLPGAPKDIVTDKQLFSSLPNFPMDSEAQITELNGSLTDETSFDLFVSYLSLIGGKDLDKTVKLLLRRIFSTELALKFSYTGKGKHKLAFIGLVQINKAITATLRNNQKTSKCTDEEIRHHIMDCFRFSKPRKGHPTE